MGKLHLTRCDEVIQKKSLQRFGVTKGDCIFQENE